MSIYHQTSKTLSLGSYALLLLCVDVGAFVAQVTRIHQDWVHTIIIGAVICALLYLTKSTIMNRMKGSKA